MQSLKEVLINSYKSEMIAFIQSNHKAFDEAITIALSDEQPFAWRAAFVLWSCMEENDPRIKKQMKRFVAALQEKQDGHQRELIKILFQMDLGDKYEGIIFDTCISLWEDISKVPSVRYNAFKMILKIVKKHPELAEEILFLTEDRYLESLSAGIRNSINRMIVSSGIIK